MKRRNIISLIFLSTLLSACSAKPATSHTFPIYETSVPESEVKSESGTEDETESKTDVTDEDDYFPNKTGFNETLSQVLADIGVTDITDFFMTSRDERAGDIHLEFTVGTPLRIVYVDCMYVGLTEHWLITSIESVDGHYYYVSRGVENTVDLYDYKTDSLISKSSETFGDPVEDFNSSLESIESDFDKAMDSIADKYGIENQ